MWPLREAENGGERPRATTAQLRITNCELRIGPRHPAPRKQNMAVSGLRRHRKITNYELRITNWFYSRFRRK